MNVSPLSEPGRVTSATGNLAGFSFSRVVSVNWCCFVGRPEHVRPGNVYDMRMNRKQFRDVVRAAFRQQLKHIANLGTFPEQLIAFDDTGRVVDSVVYAMLTAEEDEALAPMHITAVPTPLTQLSDLLATRFMRLNVTALVYVRLFTSTDVPMSNADLMVMVTGVWPKEAFVDTRVAVPVPFADSIVHEPTEMEMQGIPELLLPTWDELTPAERRLALQVEHWLVQLIVPTEPSNPDVPDYNEEGPIGQPVADQPVSKRKPPATGQKGKGEKPRHLRIVPEPGQQTG